MHPEIQSTFSLLDLRHAEVAKLLRAFRKADADRSGELSLEEFIAFIKLEHTKFAEKVFSVVDFDESGLLDFEEFVISVWNYATLTQDGVARFAFHLYDDDRSGTLSVDEIKHMFMDICGEDFAVSERAQVLYQRVELMARNQNDAGTVNPAVFDEFVKGNAGLLLPAHHMQLQIRKRIADPKFWIRIQERRLDRFAGLKDNGWRDVEQQLEEDFLERRNQDDRPVRRKVATTKTTRVLMAKREELMKKNASKKRPALATDGGSQNDYMTVFKREKRERLDVHEEMEFVLKELHPTEVPPDFLTQTEWTQLRRQTPFAKERAADAEFHDQLTEFESKLKMIRQAYPRGDDVSTLNSAPSAAGFNDDGILVH